MDTWLRVLLYVVLALAPTVLFLGLWNGLYRLRDDELTQQALERADSSPARRTLAGRMMFGTDRSDRVSLDGLGGGRGTSNGSGSGGSGSGNGSGSPSPTPTSPSSVGPADGPARPGAAADATLEEPVVCEECGAPNAPGFDRCHDCLAEL